MQEKPQVFNRLQDPAIRMTLLIALISACLVAYVYMNKPLNESFGKLIGESLQLPGDLGQGFGRFISAFVLIGVLPFIAAFYLGIKPKDMGFKFKDLSFFKDGFYLFCLIIIPVSTIVVALIGDIRTFYPFSHNLKDFVKVEPMYLIAWLLSYLIFYYLAWEFLFRGLLIYPLINALGVTEGPKKYLVGFLQIIPTTLLHINHPSTETLTAIIFGAICGHFAIKYRSFLPSLILHGVIGISLDTTLVFLT